MVQRFGVQRFKGWREVKTGHFENIGGMAFFQEVSFPGYAMAMKTVFVRDFGF
jgi:hypothetical protein